MPVAPGQLAEQEAFGALGISAAITSIAEEVIEWASNLLLQRKLTATGMTAWGSFGTGPSRAAPPIVRYPSDSDCASRKVRSVAQGPGTTFRTAKKELAPQKHSDTFRRASFEKSAEERFVLAETLYSTSLPGAVAAHYTQFRTHPVHRKHSGLQPIADGSVTYNYG